MTEATQLPAGATPEIGAIYNYGGDNYEVTRVQPGHFLAIGSDGQWGDAVEFTDHVGEGETATILYICALDDFTKFYAEGEIDENAPPEATQIPAEGPPKPTQLPGETPTTKPGEKPPTDAGEPPVDDPADGLG